MNSLFHQPWADNAQLSIDNERGRRWRLVLGLTDENQSDSGQGGPGDGTDGGEDTPGLSASDQALDDALSDLYGESRGGDLSNSNPDVARRLGDIRRYFPDTVVQIIQGDVIKGMKPRQLVQFPELLAEVEPDASLAASLITLRKTMPAQTVETARQVVAAVVADLVRRLEFPLRQAITGSINRAVRTSRPKRLSEMNWNRTIYANLKHYQPAQQTVVPEKLVGFGRRRATLRDIILCVDTSASMASSVVYAGVAASVIASIPAVSTRLVMFDTNVVDLTGDVTDPVELLFGLRLGGGTNIDRALAYCEGAITRPRDTVLVLVTDLFEGGNKEALVRRVAMLVEDGVRLVPLLALNDHGAPRYNVAIAQQFSELGVPAFACTPDKLPEVMAAALSGRDLSRFNVS